MSDNIQEPIRRTQAYWYVDGLWEIGFGALFLLLGFELILEAALTEKPAVSSVFKAFRHTLLIAGPFGVLVAVRFAKANLTYPRTGYLSYQQPRGKQLAIILAQGIGITALIGLAIVLLLGLVPGMKNILTYLPPWITFGLGIFISGMFFSLGLRTGLPRFYGLATLALLIGLGLGWYSRNLTLVTGSDFLLTGPGTFLAILGLGLSISGGITLRNYLRLTVPADGESA